MVFDLHLNAEKYILENFWMRFSESTHREMLIYRFSASFDKTRGNYDTSKIVVPEKVNLEINQVKIRKCSCYKGSVKIQTHCTQHRK